MSETYIVKCSCGYEASASYREKDNPYSSYGIWSFNNLHCQSNTVEKSVQMSLSEALVAAKPRCPECNENISASFFEEQE